MLSNFFFIIATLLLSLNFIRPFGFSISDWLYITSLGFAIFETLTTDKRNFSCWSKNRLLWFAGLILLGSIISLSKTHILSIALEEIIQQLFVITLFVSLIWVMVRRGNLEKIVLAFIFSGLITASIGAIDYFTGTRLGPFLSGTPDKFWWGRYAGSLGQPNKFGYYLTLTSLLTFVYWMRYKFSKQNLHNWIIWASAFSLQVFGIYISNSMTAYIGFFVGGVALLLSSPPVRQRILPLFLSFSALAIFIIAIAIISGKLSWLDIFPANNLLDSAFQRVTNITAQTRIVVYEQAINEVIINPLIGAGADQISTSGIDSSLRVLSGTVHNALLQIFYISGLFAFLGWLGLFISIGSVSLKLLIKKQSSLLFKGVAVAGLSVLLMDQFQNAIYQREKWIIIGLLFAMFWERKKEK